MTIAGAVPCPGIMRFGRNAPGWSGEFFKLAGGPLTPNAWSALARRIGGRHGRACRAMVCSARACGKAMLCS